MDKVAYTRSLRELTLLNPLSETLREAIANLLVLESDIEHAPDGEVIYVEGDASDGTGVLLVEGEVCISRETGDPLFVSAPALLGEMFQFNPHALRTATVTTKGPAIILEFSWKRFNERAKAELSAPDQARFVQAVEEYAFERLPDTPLLNVPALLALPRRTLLRASLALFWIATRQQHIDGELIFAEGTPTRGEGLILLEGRLALLRTGQALEVIRAPTMLGTIVRDPQDAFWRRTARVNGSAVILHFKWPDYITYLTGVLPHDTLEEALHVISGAVDTRC